MSDPRLTAPYAGWAVTPVAGDASTRRYARLTGPDGLGAILMDSSMEPMASRESFRNLAAHLKANGLAAPLVLWADETLGLMVIEDLGPMQFAEWLMLRPQDTRLLYEAAVDVIAKVQSCPAPSGLVALNPTRAAGMIAPLFEWYAPDVDPAQAAAITGRLQDALTSFAPVADTLALRDFHAENLIWRADRAGTDRVGIVDFQDAVLAPPEYDLVSLLRDARRDVPADVQSEMMARFAGLTGRDLTTVTAASAVLGVQRNLRILGIFARLARRDGKNRYLGLIPRVWGHVLRDLEHPGLAALRTLILRAIPDPVPG